MCCHFVSISLIRPECVAKILTTSRANRFLLFVIKKQIKPTWLRHGEHIVQGLCESRGGRPGLSVLTSLLVSVDVKLY